PDKENIPPGSDLNKDQISDNAVQIKDKSIALGGIDVSKSSTKISATPIKLNTSAQTSDSLLLSSRHKKPSHSAYETRSKKENSTDIRLNPSYSSMIFPLLMHTMSLKEDINEIRRESREREHRMSTELSFGQRKGYTVHPYNHKSHNHGYYHIPFRHSPSPPSYPVCDESHLLGATDIMMKYGYSNQTDTEGKEIRLDREQGNQKKDIFPDISQKPSDKDLHDDKHDDKDIHDGIVSHQSLDKALDNPEPNDPYIAQSQDESFGPHDYGDIDVSNGDSINHRVDKQDRIVGDMIGIESRIDEQDEQDEQEKESPSFKKAGSESSSQQGDDQESEMSDSVTTKDKRGDKSKDSQTHIDAHKSLASLPSSFTEIWSDTVQDNVEIAMGLSRNQYHRNATLHDDHVESESSLSSLSSRAEATKRLPTFSTLVSRIGALNKSQEQQSRKKNGQDSLIIDEQWYQQERRKEAERKKRSAKIRKMNRKARKDAKQLRIKKELYGHSKQLWHFLGSLDYPLDESLTSALLRSEGKERPSLLADWFKTFGDKYKQWSTNQGLEPMHWGLFPSREKEREEEEESERDPAFIESNSENEYDYSQIEEESDEYSEYSEQDLLISEVLSEPEFIDDVPTFYALTRPKEAKK
ncbi:hypothetical protein ADUPG1_000613, partial [Aduncisulcus paluster]